MEPQTERRKALTLAHVSDVHLSSDGPSADGLAACLRRVADHPARPGLILGGGDYIMDATATPRARVREQWDIWRRVVREAGGLPPWLHCLGNHDVFGWNHAASGADGTEKEYGKAWAMEELGLERPYYSVDRAGWHIVVLDSIHPWGRPGAGLTQALLDLAQFEWLVGDLAATKPLIPVLVLSHHPIRSTIGYHVAPPHPAPDREWTAPNAWLHMDAELIEPILRLHGNVRLCLSGHMHCPDRLERDGIVFIGSGAVCGDLWRGEDPTHPACFGIATLYDDGGFDYEHVRLNG